MSPRRFAPLLALLLLTACSSGTGAGPDASSAPGTTSAPPTASSSPSAPATASTTATTSSTASSSCVDQTLAKLSRKARAAQLLMVRTDNIDPSPDAPTVASSQVGGVFLAGRSQVAAGSIKESLATLQAAVAAAGGVPPLVAIDQEGGQVQTLRSSSFTRLPPALTQGTWAPSRLSASAATTARELRQVGVTMNLAPVADTVAVADRDRNPPIGELEREYGSDPAKVGAAVGTVVKAQQSAGVLTTIKHFPGLGRVRTNTDLGRGATDGEASASDPDLGPFRAGIEAGTAAVMISSAAYPRLDPDNLAVFSSKVITGLLRGQLGFDGLVTSDDLGQAKAVSNVAVGQRAVRFVAAGGDLVLTNHPSDVPAMTSALTARAASSPAFATRMDDAVRHVLAAKERAGLISC